jgi:hypothetical protein
MGKPNLGTRAILANVAGTSRLFSTLGTEMVA